MLGECHDRLALGSPGPRPFGRSRLSRYTMLPNEMRAALHHVRFVGGGSGAGKSTVAERLVARHGLRLYQAEQFSTYMRRPTPAGAPLLHAFLAMDMDERWVNRSPQDMFNTFHGFHGEQFDLIVKDLLALPRQPRVIAEGFTLLPRLVAPLLSGPNQAVWLAPTSEFRGAAFDSRGSTWDIPRKTSNPERGLANMLMRDRIFSGQVVRDATALGLAVIDVDLGQTVEGLVNRVAAVLGINPA